ncbi:hypothetical protein EG831_07990 [bacterium]|nr:hypothetical protein [bacterium]
MNGPLDSWVLLSVLMCGPRRGTLRDIIACGDYANHAVFPFARLRDGLFALQTTGLVSHEDDRYRASPRARRFWREARKKERGVFKAWGLLDRWLERQVLAPAGGGTRRIARKKYDAAVKDYLDHF